MTRRFRVVAGPNGSGKTTLMRRLAADYAVNFYSVVNADDILAEIARTGGYSPRIPIDGAALRDFAMASSYPNEVKRLFADGAVFVDADCVRFAPGAAGSYSAALLANFVAAEHVRQGVSFSQETAFSHPSKIDALAAAREAGFRTYLYFVATDSPDVNVARVGNRVRLAGHPVPPEKIVSRYAKSIENAAAALPYLSRACFFDNSAEEMRYIGEWNAEGGFAANGDAAAPRWFGALAEAMSGKKAGTPEADEDEVATSRLAQSAAEASREAVARAFAAGLSVTVAREGKVIELSPDGTERVVKTI